ncbi:hypothetical protein CHUAL_004553 [Chamberlinius hualienensis]
MPVFSLYTNVPKEKIPPNFLKETSTLIARTLGKPESYVVVHVLPDQLLSWGGATGEPAGLAKLLSIGRLGVEENKRYSAIIGEHVEKNLGISKSKLYIDYLDADKAAVGYNGTTFHDLL